MKKYILIVSIIAICAFFLGYCNRSEIPDSSNKLQDKLDSFTLINSILQESKTADLKTIATLSVKVDSLKSRKPTYVTRYIQTANTITLEDSANCPEVVSKFNDLRRAADSLNAANDSIISYHVLRDSSYINVIQIQEKQLAVKDTTIQILSESLSKTSAHAECMQKKVKRNRIIAGIATGIAAIEAGVILLMK